MLEKLKALAVRFLDAIFWQTKEEFIWWKGDLTVKGRIIRAAKQFDAWLMDLLYPELDDQH